MTGSLHAAAPPPLRRDIRKGVEYAATKLLLVISGERAVTLEIPQDEQRFTSLLYSTTSDYTRQEAELGLAEVSDGRSAVRFEPCAKGTGEYTQYPGGLVIAGARCLPLNVWIDGRESPVRRVLSFGVGNRCS
jgi:hypothetical protein